MRQDKPNNTEVVAGCGLIGVALLVSGAAMSSLPLMIIGAAICLAGANLIV